MWLNFLQHFNGTTFALSDKWVSSNTLQLCSDASGFAFAAVFGDMWIRGRFVNHWLDYHIAVKELLPIVLALYQWGNRFQNSRVLFLCDNDSVVHIINKHTSKDSKLMNLIRKFVVITLKFNIDFRAQHISGKSNTVCDALSRFQEERARAAAPSLEPTPQEILTDWQNWAS